MISKKTAERVGKKLGIDFSVCSLKEFQMGMQAELEHRNVTHGDLVMTGKIAQAHLQEMPDYYTRLKKMEKGG